MATMHSDIPGIEAADSIVEVNGLLALDEGTRRDDEVVGYVSEVSTEGNSTKRRVRVLVVDGGTTSYKTKILATVRGYLVFGKDDRKVSIWTTLANITTEVAAKKPASQLGYLWCSFAGIITKRAYFKVSVKDGHGLWHVAILKEGSPFEVL